MLFNKIPCLDKGYIALISSSNDSKRLNELKDEFFGAQDTPELLELGTMTLVFRCPLFVQLNLSKFGFKILTGFSPTLEAYMPNVGEIGSPDQETNRLISDDLMRTTEALLINPRAYQADGCDLFISQVISPISTYTTLIVHGSYNQWRKYTNQAGLPAPLEAFRLAALQIQQAEWR